MKNLLYNKNFKFIKKILVIILGIIVSILWIKAIPNSTIYIQSPIFAMIFGIFLILLTWIICILGFININKNWNSSSDGRAPRS